MDENDEWMKMMNGWKWWMDKNDGWIKMMDG